MARVEYLNVSGLRSDGRRAGEVRALAASCSVLPHTDGSALLECGGTKVLAIVSGPHEASKRATVKDAEAASINVEYSIAPFALADRRRKRGMDRRIVEVSAALKQCFETVIDTKLYPQSRIDISIYVLQSDGNPVSAAINAGTLALMDAGIAMFDFLVSCSAVFIQRVALVDPNHVECSAGGAEFTLAIHGRSSKVTLSTMEARLPLEAFESVMEAAMRGCEQMLEIMTQLMKEHTAKAFRSRGAITAS